MFDLHECNECSDQMPPHVVDEDINISIYTPSAAAFFIDSDVPSDLSQILRQNSKERNQKAAT